MAATATTGRRAHPPDQCCVQQETSAGASGERACEWLLGRLVTGCSQWWSQNSNRSQGKTSPDLIIKTKTDTCHFLRSLNDILVAECRGLVFCWGTLFNNEGLNPVGDSLTAAAGGWLTATTAALYRAVQLQASDREAWPRPSVWASLAVAA